MEQVIDVVVDRSSDLVEREQSLKDRFKGVLNGLYEEENRIGELIQVLLFRHVLNVWVVVVLVSVKEALVVFNSIGIVGDKIVDFLDDVFFYFVHEFIPVELLKTGCNFPYLVFVVYFELVFFLLDSL